MALTEFAVDLFDDWLAPRGSRWPRPATRPAGDRTSCSGTRDARALYERLLERGVIPDYREPQGIRMGMAPLTTAVRRRGRRHPGDLAELAG